MGNLFGLDNIHITSKEDLNKYISDEQIMTYYFKEFELNIHYLSPLHVEKDPSFMITYYNNELKWRDFGISKQPFNAIEFVQKLYSIGFYDALNKIYGDIVLDNKIPIVKDYKKLDTLTSFVEYSNSWEDWQLDYWFKGNIKESTLDIFNVHWCKELWFNNKLFSKGSKSNLSYFYDHSTVPFEYSWTVYRPFANISKKFRKQNIANHIMGYDLLPPTAEILVITKSYKDIMILYELGICAIAPHSENVPISKEVIDELKSRFGRIYVNYDNDSTGIKSSIEFTRKYDLDYWNIPLKLNCKDPFECSQIYGLDKVYNLLYERIERN